MESVKKILPYIIVAIIFAVGGFFIGQGKLDDQGASLYAVKTKASIAKPAGLGTTGPTGGDSSGIIVLTASEEECIKLGGTVLGTIVGSTGNPFGGHMVCAMLKDVGSKNTPIPSIKILVGSVWDCNKLGGELGEEVVKGKVWECAVLKKSLPTTATPVFNKPTLPTSGVKAKSTVR
jgi:hypothetical protein